MQLIKQNIGSASIFRWKTERKNILYTGPFRKRDSLSHDPHQYPPEDWDKLIH
jgi:hypothetical protein